MSPRVSPQFFRVGIVNSVLHGGRPPIPPPHTALLNSHLPNISYFRNIKGFHHPGFIDLVIRIVEFVIIAHLLQ